MNRRGFLTGLISTLAAPAIVRAELLMPVKVIRTLTVEEHMELILGPMMNNLAENVADAIMYGASYAKVTYDDNATEGASCQIYQPLKKIYPYQPLKKIYPYQPLKIKPIWTRDLFIDRSIKSPTNGS